MVFHDYIQYVSSLRKSASEGLLSGKSFFPAFQKMNSRGRQSSTLFKSPILPPEQIQCPFAHSLNFTDVFRAAERSHKCFTALLADGELRNI